MQSFLHESTTNATGADASSLIHLRTFAAVGGGTLYKEDARWVITTTLTNSSLAHPRMVRDLLEGFVGGEWLRRLDFTTLERVSDNYVSDDLRARADDIVWRARCGDQYVYFLIEFQSRVEPFMAIRVLTYVGLLYQDLVRANVIERVKGLPTILPIVLYNGTSRWSAADDIGMLLRHVPEGLERYRPQLRYLPIDEGSFGDSALSVDRNLVALLFRLESCRRIDQLESLLSSLLSWLMGAEQDSLGRAFGVWLERVILPRLPRGRVRTINDLWEKKTMLSEWFDEREAQFRKEGRMEGRLEGLQEGEATLLILQLKKRFGELPPAVRNRVLLAGQDTLEQWAERLLEATSLQELFEGESIQ